MSGSGHCSQCAAVNPHTAVFCSACGARLAWAQAAQWADPTTPQPQGPLPGQPVQQQPAAASQPNDTAIDTATEAAAGLLAAGFISSFFQRCCCYCAGTGQSGSCCSCVGCIGCLTLLLPFFLLGTIIEIIESLTGGG